MLCLLFERFTTKSSVLQDSEYPWRLLAACAGMTEEISISGEVVSEADEAPASSNATAESHSQESAGSSQESRLQAHRVEHMLADSPEQADDPTSAESSGTTHKVYALARFLQWASHKSCS